MAFPACTVTALAVPASLGTMFWIKPEMKEGVVVLARDQNYIAAAPTISAARTSARHKLLTPERETSVSTVAGFHGHNDFVYEQEDAKLALCLGFDDVDELAQAPAIAKLNRTRYPRKQGVVFADANVLARLVPCPALPHDDRTARHHLTAEYLDAQPLRVRVAPVL
jgi:hypothetical protein